MEQINQDKNVRLCYFTVPTNKGIGYVCIALRRPEKDSGSITYTAGFSFCSPQEGMNFSKQKARSMAIGRLNTFDRGNQNRITFACAAKNLTDVFKEALACAEMTQFRVEENEKSTHLSRIGGKKINMKWFVPNWLRERNRNGLIFGLNVNGKSAETEK